MLVCVCCTGNVARSPVLAAMLRELRPDLEVVSAALGRKAIPGQRMRRQMRELCERVGLGRDAEAHRSQLFVHLGRRPTAVVYFQRSHAARLDELGYDGRRFFFPEKDPAFGTAIDYVNCFGNLRHHADVLASTLPRERSNT